jgi:uncharacterized protein
MAVAGRSGADIMVVTLFAFLHDACRWDDGADLEHGSRSAELVMEMQGKIFSISDNQLILLAEACRYHTYGKCSDDPTIGTCWDADRLDLGRVGIIPNPRYMSTAPGREIARLGSVELYKQE